MRRRPSRRATLEYEYTPHVRSVSPIASMHEEEEVAEMSVAAASLALLLVTVTTSFCADYCALPIIICIATNFF